MKGFAKAVQANAKARIRRQMDYRLYKGVAIELHDSSRADEVAAMAGVRTMSPVEMLSMDTDISDSLSGQPHGGKGPGDRPEKRSLGRGRGPLARRVLSNDTMKTSNTSHAMMQIDRLHRKGITGKGSKIAIIDTGVSGRCRRTDDTGSDLHVAGLGRLRSPGARGLLRPRLPRQLGADLLEREQTPRDCDGHGTFISGLIAAQPNELGLIGAAPGVELGMYRVTCDGHFTSDIMIDAVYRAHQDGASIISSSLGHHGGFKAGLLTDAASRLTASGVVFVQAAGNSGGRGVFTLLDPAGGPGVITVGSMKNAVSMEFLYQAIYTIDGSEAVSFSVWPAYLPHLTSNFTGAPMELYAASRGPDDSDDEDCGPLPDDTPDLSDKLVLIRSCASFQDQVASLAAKGALRVLAYNKPDDGPPDTYYHFGEPLDKIMAFSMIETDVAALLLEATRAGRKALVTAFPRKTRRGNIESPRMRTPQELSLSLAPGVRVGTWLLSLQ